MSADSIADRERHLSWDACYNIRDLGGYPTVDGRQTRWGAIIRADNLYRLTEQGQAALVAYGISTIIDLRSTAELEREPNPFGQNTQVGVPSYLHLSLEEAADQVAELASDAAATVEDMYCLMIDNYRERFAAVFRAIAEASDEGAVLVHCNGGKDRTGVVIGLLLALAGVSDSTIADDYAESYDCLRPLFDSYLASVPDATKREHMAALFLSPHEAMIAMLEYVRSKYGGVEEYLSAAGVGREDLEKTQRRLVG